MVSGMTNTTELGEILSTFQPKEHDQTLYRFLRFLAKSVDASAASALCITKKSGGRNLRFQTLLDGWKVIDSISPPGMRSPDEMQKATEAYIELTNIYGSADPFTNLVAETAGDHRVLLTSDLPSKESWENHWVYKIHLKNQGFGDRCHAVFSLDDQTEVIYMLDRGLDQPLFDEENALALGAILPFCGPISKHLSLARGALPAEAQLLSSRETEVVSYILKGLKEKDIADELGITKQSIHTAITRIYRKYNVSGRAALTALWL